jgi:uncharacterized protein YkwD
MNGKRIGKLGALVLALLLVGTASPSPAWAEIQRGKVSVLEEVLERLQAAREAEGAPPLRRVSELDEVAGARAREIAARPASKRHSKERSIYGFMEDRGLRRPYRAREQIDMQVHASRPAEGIVERWSGLSEAWAFALDPASDSIGVGEARSADGWLVFVAVVIQHDRAVADLELLEREVLAQANEERTSRGLAALVPVPALEELARGHSRDMGARTYFSHSSPEGLTVSQRAERRGLDYRRIGENISRSWGVQDPGGTAVHGWMTSPGHREALLSPHYIETGVGVALGKDGFLYFTQVFRQPLVRPERIAPFPRPQDEEEAAGPSPEAEASESDGAGTS